MGKREFNNRLSLRGADNINKVIAPSGYARSSDLRVSENILIRRPLEFVALQKIGVTILKIGRSLDVFWRKRGMTIKKYLQKIGVTSFKRGMTTTAVILGQQRVTRVSRIIKWILGSSPRMTIGLIFFICTSMTGTGRAECIPTPDCASIGYTATSCDGKFTRCPFDTSKLFCVPCDSSFQYACNGEGQIGQGESCDGKYIECGCTDGYEWDDENKVCTSSCSDTSCSVGNIVYSDGTCCKEKLDNKTPIGVVVKDNALVMSKDRVTMTWSSAYIDTSLTNMSSSQAQDDMNGKSNTAVIVAAHPSETTSNNAAIYCNKYTTAGTSAGDWYLPAAGELYSYVYGNSIILSPVYTGSLGWSSFSYYFWSSSEFGDSSAWIVTSSDGDVFHYLDKNNRSSSVSCLLDISSI